MTEREPFVPGQEEPREASRYRSLFWPIVLIGVGAVWLLANLGLVASGALGLLWRLWPLLLIVAGLDILFGRRWPALGALLGVAVVGGAIILLLIGSTAARQGRTPNLFGVPFDARAEVRTEEVSVPLNGAQEALVDLSLGRWRTTLTTLPESSDLLLEGEIDYTGNLRVESRTDDGRAVARITHQDEFFGFLGDIGGSGEWTLALSPRVPTELRLDVASGRLDADLRGANLTRLEFDGGSGGAALMLPTTGLNNLDAGLGSGRVTMNVPDGATLQGSVDVASGGFDLEVGSQATIDLTVEGASGGTDVILGEGINGQLDYDGASGAMRLDIPEGTPLRVEVRDSGSGSVRLPDGLQRLEGDADDEEGVWETPDYASARERLLVILRVGSGSITIR